MAMDVTNQWPMCLGCKQPMMWSDPYFVCNCNVPRGSTQSFGGSYVKYVFGGQMKPRHISEEEDYEAAEESEPSCGRQPSAEDRNSASGQGKADDDQSVPCIVDSAKSMDRH